MIDDGGVAFPIDGEGWRARAACRRDVCEVHPQCFDQLSWNELTMTAVKVCTDCPVRVLCAGWAKKERWSGVAGGVLWQDGVERRAMHGISGYMRGCRCSECRRRSGEALKKLGWAS